MAVSLWWTERTEHGEVLVFRAGELVYKRWPGGNSVLIGAVPRFAYWKPPPASAPAPARGVALEDRGGLGG